MRRWRAADPLVVDALLAVACAALAVWTVLLTDEPPFVGALVWVFQDGNLAGLLGVDTAGSLDIATPLLIFVIAFGLSMDYEVSLLARIKEAYDETGDNDRAVALGLRRRPPG